MVAGINIEVNKKPLSARDKLLNIKATLKKKTKVYVLAVNNVFDKPC